MANLIYLSEAVNNFVFIPGYQGNAAILLRNLIDTENAGPLINLLLTSRGPFYNPRLLGGQIIQHKGFRTSGFGGPEIVTAEETLKVAEKYLSPQAFATFLREIFIYHDLSKDIPTQNLLSEYCTGLGISPFTHTATIEAMNNLRSFEKFSEAFDSLRATLGPEESGEACASGIINTARSIFTIIPPNKNDVHLEPPEKQFEVMLQAFTALGWWSAAYNQAFQGSINKPVQETASALSSYILRHSLLYINGVATPIQHTDSTTIVYNTLRQVITASQESSEKLSATQIYTHILSYARQLMEQPVIARWVEAQINTCIAADILSIREAVGRNFGVGMTTVEIGGTTLT